VTPTFVRTTLASEAHVAACRACKQVIERNQWWPISKSVAMHTATNPGHRVDYYKLTFEEEK
jgi:hypothetical protein